MFSFRIIAQFLAFFGISKRKILYEYAKSQLGKQKPGIPDTAPDMVNCVEALNQIGIECFGEPFCYGASTITLNAALKMNPRFRAVLTPDVLPGDIIVSPTQPGRSGHTGIVGEKERIYSNNSFTGCWEDKYSFETWGNYYEKQLKLKTYFYRIIL